MALTLVQAPPDPARLPLPALRNDLHIQRVGTYRDGSPRYRIHDALRNRYFELGLLDVEVLAHWRAGDTATDIAGEVSLALDTLVEPEEVLVLRDFLVRHQLVDVADGASYAILREMWRRSQHHWLLWLLHNYLFFRLPLLRPDAMLVRWLPRARLLAARPVLFGLVLLAVVTPFLVAREWVTWRQSFAELFSFNGLVACAVAAFFTKILHEFGHAFVARHHGVRVPVMGIAFLVLWPVLYTDTSDSWKLADHKARFRIAAAGVATEVTIALLCLFLWTIVPPGALRDALFFVSTTSLILTLSINASPFMRFDGYFLLSDALDFPNLHERSAAMARWWLRRALWGLDIAPPEHHSRRMGNFLVAFALATWLYRAVVFLGIAVLVYFAFFKLLGIFLMALELAWFIFRPVWAEGQELWKMRTQLRPRWGRLGAIVALVLGSITFLAWTGEAQAPALLLAREESRLYPPVAARVQALHVRGGQMVRGGDVLLQLEAPDLAYRNQANEVRIQRVNGELGRIAASERQRERSLVLQEELAQALSEQQAIREELARLTVRAAHAGRLVDVPPGLAEQRWVNPRQLMGRVVDQSRSQVRAWVSESQVRRLQVGDVVAFIPRMPELPRVQARIARIDTNGTGLLPHPLLGAPSGGDLPATQNAKGEWEMKKTLYQVDLQVEGAPVPGPVLAGHIHVPTGPVDGLAASTRQFLTVLVRESGF